MRVLGGAVSAGVAFWCAMGSAGAEELRGGFSADANVAFVSDYRARGITISDSAFAVQGGFNVEHENGFSAGVWGSSMDETAGGTLELDLVAAQTFTINGAEVSVGGTAYVYPSSDDLNYGEFNTSIAGALGPVDTTFGVAYAWEQDNIGSEDNLYVFLNGVTPLAKVAGSPIALGGSLGYEDGSLAVEETKLDWSVSLTLDCPLGTLGVSYVDTDLDDPIGDATGVISLTRTF